MWVPRHISCCFKRQPNYIALQALAPRGKPFRKEPILYLILSILLAILFSFFTLVFVISLASSFYIHNYNRASVAVLVGYVGLLLSRVVYVHTHALF